MISRRTMLKSAIAAPLIIPAAKHLIKPANAFPVPRAVHFDGGTGMVNFGPSPDTVQSMIGFTVNGSPLLDITRSYSFTISVALKMRLDTFEVHDDGNIISGPAYPIVLESQFLNATYLNGLWLRLFKWSDGFASWELYASDDDQATNWILAYALDCIPLDNSWQILELFGDVNAGNVDYAINGVPASSPILGQPNPSIVADFTGPFTMPISGMGWQIACDTFFSDVTTNWSTGYNGDMAELYVYSGPIPTEVPTTQDTINHFVAVQGMLERVVPLGVLGTAPYGTMPTVYCTGGPPGPGELGFEGSFTDGNSSPFINTLANSPVLPYQTYALPPDYDGWVGSGVLGQTLDDPY